MGAMTSARRRLAPAGIATLVALSGIGIDAQKQADRPAGPPRSGNQPPIAQDVNPAWGVVEVNLEASETTVEYAPGLTTTAYAYNGSVPGPTIEAHVGQTLVVNFTNNLSEGTSIHWHGMDVPANMDGSNIAQQEVPPGGQFRYEFKLIREGHYWYHPHFSTNTQIERGLQGSILVHNMLQDLRVGIPRSREYVLTLDDVKLDDATGELTPFATDLSNGMDPLDRAEELFNGRQGNHLITNGTEVPTIDVANGQPIRLRIVAPTNGRFMRLSVPGHTLAQIGSDATLFNDVLFKDPIQMVPDPDGSGTMISDPDPGKGLLLTPSSRADVVLVPSGRPGQEVYLEWHDIATGRHSTFATPTGGVGFGDAADDGKRPPASLVRLRFRGGRGDGWRPVLPLNGHWPTHAIPVDADTDRLSVFFGHTPPANDGAVTFFSAVKLSDDLQAALDTKLAQAEDASIVGPVPGMVGPPPFMPQPFPVLSPADALHAEVGDVKVWEVTSFTGGAHTFHTHGFPFQPLELIEVNLDGDSPAERVVRTPLPLTLQDNFHMPGRPGAMGRSWTILRAAVRFDDSDRPFFLRRTDEQMVASGKVPVTNDPLDPREGTSGGWLAHCHILEHSSRGMLTFLNLVLP